jgi:hypothetical protein
MAPRCDPDLPKASLFAAESGTASSVPSRASTLSPRKRSSSLPSGRGSTASAAYASAGRDATTFMRRSSESPSV